jgi:hypothetical protein
MNENTIKIISDGIDMIAQKLGVAVDKVYPIMLKQAHVDFIIAVTKSLFGIISIIIMIIFVKKMLNITIKDTITEKKDVISLGYFICAVIFSIIGLVSTIIYIPEAVQIYINPDYYIFKEYVQPLIN